MRSKLSLLFFLLATICASAQNTIYRIPIVVHVLHTGDPIGTGYNFPKERIVAQINSLNEDFRRKENTPGFNDHPDGADTHIEFVLAQTDPDGNPTDGIVRVDMTTVHLSPSPGDIISTCSLYSYWDPDRYLNVWCMATGLPPGLFLGSARFPITDLPGLNENSSQPDGDGVFINALNFGSGADHNDPDYNMGRTLTHETGHFLGLLHTWGSINNSRQCDEYTDYCDDTPPIPVATNGCPASAPIACDGRLAMSANYMDGSYDACMNIFTNHQVARMRTVLENSPHRKSLTTSPVIDRSGEITGIDDPTVTSVGVYPNPTIDKIYVSLGGQAASINVYCLTGQSIFNESFDATTSDIEIPVSGFRGQVIVVSVEMPTRSRRFLVNVR